MSITREYNVPLRELSTFRIGGTAREVVTVTTEADLEEVFRLMPQDEKWFLLGGGSNIVFPDGDLDMTLIRPQILGKRLVDETTLVVGSGEIWDSVVAFAVENDLSGIETLSWIPGTAGATPVQNVGAYGTEIRDVLTSLRAYDLWTKSMVVFSNKECKFGYRDSIFKNAGKGRYVITEITLALSRELPDVPQYPGVADYLAEHNIRAASLEDIRNAIIAIRTKKLPDPKEVASVGSFFKNSFVPIEKANQLRADFPTLAIYDVDTATAKVGTGSLIDTMGWKGKRIGNFSLYKGNAMVIVNEGGGTRAELSDVILQIRDAVQEKYGISIEPEPELLS
ncbi:MAG: UDP-N-acetylmuramate dehydrogenase [bacterium]